MVRASKADAAGLEAASGDSGADGRGTESRAGEHLMDFISKTADTAAATTDLVYMGEKLVRQVVVEVGLDRIGIVKS